MVLPTSQRLVTRSSGRRRQGERAGELDVAVSMQGSYETGETDTVEAKGVTAVKQASSTDSGEWDHVPCSGKEASVVEWAGVLGSREEAGVAEWANMPRAEQAGIDADGER
jgi:hypothetical protein